MAASSSSFHSVEIAIPNGVLLLDNAEREDCYSKKPMSNTFSGTVRYNGTQDLVVQARLYDQMCDIGKYHDFLSLFGQHRYIQSVIPSISKFQNFQVIMFRPIHTYLSSFIDVVMGKNAKMVETGLQNIPRDIVMRRFTKHILSALEYVHRMDLGHGEFDYDKMYVALDRNYELDHEDFAQVKLSFSGHELDWSVKRSEMQCDPDDMFWQNDKPRDCRSVSNLLNTLHQKLDLTFTPEWRDFKDLVSKQKSLNMKLVMQHPGSWSVAKKLRFQHMLWPLWKSHTNVRDHGIRLPPWKRAFPFALKTITQHNTAMKLNVPDYRENFHDFGRFVRNSEEHFDDYTPKIAQ